MSVLTCLLVDMRQVVPHCITP